MKVYLAEFEPSHLIPNFRQASGRTIFWLLTESRTPCSIFQVYCIIMEMCQCVKVPFIHILPGLCVRSCDVQSFEQTLVGTMDPDLHVIDV